MALAITRRSQTRHASSAVHAHQSAWSARSQPAKPSAPAVGARAVAPRGIPRSPPSSRDRSSSSTLRPMSVDQLTMGAQPSGRTTAMRGRSSSVIGVVASRHTWSCRSLRHMSASSVCRTSPAHCKCCCHRYPEHAHRACRYRCCYRIRHCHSQTGRSLAPAKPRDRGDRCRRRCHHRGTGPKPGRTCWSCRGDWMSRTAASCTEPQ